MPPLNRMWRNNGNGTFTDQTEATGLAAPVPTYAAVGSDFNNDRAVDVLISGWYKGCGSFPKPARRQIPSRRADGTLFPGSVLAMLDFDHDGWMDVAYTGFSGQGITLWRNLRGMAIEQVKLTCSIAVPLRFRHKVIPCPENPV